MDLGLKDKVAIVGGASKGLGKACALVLAQEGAKVAICSRSKPDLESAAEEIASAGGGEVMTFAGDLDHHQTINELISATVTRFGRLDIIVHCIAFANREDLEGRFVDTGRDGFRIALEVSAYSLLPLVRHAAPLMTGGGSVVAMTFDASQRVYPGYNVMGTAKAALENEVRQLASDLGPDNIRVNAISAGPIKTLAASGIGDFRYILKWNELNSPLRRNVTIEDVGGAGLYLRHGVGLGDGPGPANRRGRSCCRLTAGEAQHQRADQGVAGTIGEAWFSDHGAVSTRAARQFCRHRSRR